MKYQICRSTSNSYENINTHTTNGLFVIVSLLFTFNRNANILVSLKPWLNRLPNQQKGEKKQRGTVNKQMNIRKGVSKASNQAFNLPRQFQSKHRNKTRWENIEFSLPGDDLNAPIPTPTTTQPAAKINRNQSATIVERSPEFFFILLKCKQWKYREHTNSARSMARKQFKKRVDDIANLGASIRYNLRTAIVAAATAVCVCVWSNFLHRTGTTSVCK